MTSKDLPFLLTLYLSCGLMWTLWQAQSKFTRALAERFQEEGRSWMFLIAFAGGVLLWPLGPLGYLIFFATKTWRKDGL